jgi:hypothetical protein
MYRSLWHAYSDVKLRWIVVADADEDPDVEDRLIQTNPLIDIVVGHHLEHAFGHPQRNYALDHLTSPGWCWWLDDDNIMHPHFLQAFRRFVVNGWKGVLIGEQRTDGYFAPVRGNIDIGQIIVHTDVIGDERWGLYYTADGDFIRALLPKYDFAYVDEELAYHNWISGEIVKR